jgi:hypothetical protein
MMAAAILTVPRASGATDAPVAETASHGSHVRSLTPALVAMIHQATERSAIFRRLVEKIDASDSIVFDNEGDCRRGVHACFVSVASSQTSRYMFVLVDTRKADWDLIGSIGHELRHTIEVIAEPGIRDNAAMYFFYEQISTHDAAGTHETRAAIDAGNMVRSEVRTFNRQARSE